MYTDRKGREILTLDDFFAAIHEKKIRMSLHSHTK